MSRLAAVVGIGQTQYKSARDDVSIAGLVNEAARRALEDAGLGWNDVDAVIIGKAPDMFEGVVMPELYLADALGANGKPIMRVHTAGSVGGSTAVVAASHVTSGSFDRILTVTFEKQSESNAMWALSIRRPFSMHLNAGAGGHFAPSIREYMRRSNAPAHVGPMVAVKDRRNALLNPLAHLKIPDISLDMVMESPMLWDPVRFLESCPSSDGACAMVIANEELAAKAPGKPAWIRGMAMRSETLTCEGRDEVNPLAGTECARDVYAQAGIHNPRKDVDMAEIYVPFSWYEPMWLENLGFAEAGDGWKLTEQGETEIGGSIPFNCSGGVLSTNAIGASGMIRFAEAAMQVRGTAGEHQVDGASMAIGHAYGASAQFFAMWAVSSDKP